MSNRATRNGDSGGVSDAAKAPAVATEVPGVPAIPGADVPGAGVPAVPGVGEIPGAGAEDFEHGGVAQLVELIHAGRVALDDLPMAVKRECVEQLSADGFSASQIAELLRTTPRTIRRDRAAIRREQAIAPDPTLGDEFLGEFERLTLQSIQRLSRLSADPTNPPYARLWAEEAISRNYQRLIDTARKLNYIDAGNRRLQRRIDDNPAEIEYRRKRAERRLKNPMSVW